MEQKHGVMLTVLSSKPGREIYLVQQGADVNTFGQCHPLLAGVLQEFRRSGRAMVNKDIVDITARPQALVISSRHRQRRVNGPQQTTHTYPPLSHS